ncbi:hypothetical protein BFW01_g9627 [Lasiodiplodia theobromae]|uniref:Uncharacterized protein n=1 Tax=Lasiodiplodia theobromae TaxID=45133 RepID=A0A5N5DMZ1_9PEZI|nr:uncharacterized protein LTHEOB_2443 [Lasiodiplodia theobromae]KAB2578691.1 hypothetical protein DBV05_g2524 [Lasiodiplodia theobromae]KAF4535451.1 hypothetical protein LTHEOB_2443 [Lasiodiplodia theobromae]KAF9638730.1 hypothetical protein BFW01_g9627 [Lasiodiplodia theobromae]
MSTADQSPFSIRPEDVQRLESSQPFNVLRSYLAVNATNEMCPEHACCSPEPWLLHRDILHALIMPVVQLFHRASRLAEAALCSSKAEDLEMAFTGDARSGFLWLQCFLADEEDWCQSIGCPACIVTSTLSTEQHLRITFTALNLAEESSYASGPSQSLPSLPFFADALRYAIDTDPFWESYPGASSTFEASAQKLTAHIHALMDQCGEIEALVSDYDATPTDSQTSSQLVKFQQRAQPVRAPSGFLRIGAESKCPAVKPSRMARRQQRMRQEEQMLLQQLVAQCWGQVALAGAVPGARDRAHVKALMRGADSVTSFLLGTGSSTSFGEKRRRSLTCP